MLMQTGGQILGSALGGASQTTQSAANLAYGLTTQVGRELPHSRKQESEADRVGLTYMARAGYDPAKAVEFWKRFAAYNQQAGGSAGLAFMRTHPTDDKRIADLEKLLPQAEAEYHRTTQGIGAPTGNATGNTPVGRSPTQP